MADALVDRGLLDRAAVKQVLEQACDTGAQFTELLVRENLVSDWEVARVAAEVFQLAFLPVDVIRPNAELLSDLDHDYLRRNGLVPIDRFGDVITVAMPGLVPSSVLNGITTTEPVTIMPVVGLVGSNRAWLEEHLPVSESIAAALPLGETDQDGTGWTEIFDAGDEAVQLNMPEETESAPGDPPRKIVLDDSDFS
jgi:hypothetical protein